MFKPSLTIDPNPQLTLLTRAVSSSCKRCDTCVKECAFLQTYGNPGTIADLLTEDIGKWRHIAYQCSFCRLCMSGCPQNIDLPAMLLEYRRAAVSKNIADLSVYQQLLNYEKKGISSRYAFYGIPDHCDTIFFPGCTLSGTRSVLTLKAYLYLKGLDESTGIVLDCCTKPSHDLGLQDFFSHHFAQMITYLKNKGIKKIITACPSCHNIFSSYAEDFNITTIYQVMAESKIENSGYSDNTITIHDSCQARFEPEVQDAVRSIIRCLGFKIKEMPHGKSNTYCCGEGSGAGFAAPQFAKAWKEKRCRETGTLKVAGYCAGCTKKLSSDADMVHLLDLVFTGQKALKGKIQGSRPPLTYLGRLNLKRKLKSAYLS